MASIHIKNVGPIKDTGKIDLTRITLLLGPQGSGKSTFMKILCYVRWMEKQLMSNPRKTSDYSDYTKYQRFIRKLGAFFRFDKSFFSTQSEIIYDGDCYTIHWSGGKNASIKRKKDKDNIAGTDHNPKISFVPAERNLVSVIPNVDRSYRGRVGEDLLLNFLLELENEAKQSYTENSPLSLSIDGNFEFYHKEGANMIKLKNTGRAISTYYASSGIQSAFPIDVISAYLYNCIGEFPKMSASEISEIVKLIMKDSSEEEKLSARIKKMTYSSIQLYVEEPEQNLYPEAQRQLLLRLVSLLYKARDKETHPSSMVITTHSPYMLSVLNTQINISREVELLEKESDVDPELANRLKDFKDKFLPNHNDPIGGYLPLSDYSAYFVDKGRFVPLIDEEFPMVDGTQLDGVSDSVEEFNSLVYKELYGRG